MPFFRYFSALSVFFSTLFCTAAHGEAMSFGPAQWLQDPAFANIEVINIYHKDKAERPKLSGPQNVHTYFRKDITLPATPVSAVMTITGDDYYKMYINGAFVVQGPEPGYPFAHPYYTLDVTAFLHEGANCLAAHAYYQGLCNRVWNSADNRAGFILALRLTFADGSQQEYLTDSTWRCWQSKTFGGDRTTGYSTQFLEDLDLRKEPKGWRDAGFDDGKWLEPLAGTSPHHTFTPQVTPPLQVYGVKPINVTRTGDGRYIYDFGREIVGCARVRAKGKAGQTLRVRHGEEMLDEQAVRYKMRASCEYEDTITLADDSADVAEFFDYKAFRFIEIADAPEEPELWVDAQHYPYEETTSAAFACSDLLLEQMWALCRDGIRWGSQGSFLDCPTREKGQYLGDALITSHGHMLLTGDGRLTAKALRDFQHSQRICPGIMAVAPGSFMQEIAEYSLQWPLMLRNYYLYTGDAPYTKALMDAAFGPLFDYFAKYETPTGLLSGMKEKWVLVDWPDKLRDDYEYDYAKERENAVLNGFYYASLDCAADLMQRLGQDGSAYAARAARVKEAFIRQLTDPATGLYLDAPGATHSALHANAIPLCFGMVAEGQAPKLLDLIRGKGLSCGVYIAPFVIEACYEAGDPMLGYSLLTNRSEHSWHEMLRHGATTCMEAWGPDQKKNTSWCHPWSSSPIYLITERVMGLTPAKPGWQAIRFAPQIPDSLEWASLTLPVPAGFVTARYDAACGYVVTAPPDVPVETEPAINGLPVEVRHARSHGREILSDAQRETLKAAAWDTQAGNNTAVWVSISEQMFRIVRNGQLLWQASCSTAANGAGSEMNSLKTPLGWHLVSEKIGDGARWGQIFKSKKPTGIWRPGDKTEEDLVLTRVLTLSGLEPGRNQGGNVDSYARAIYIHGTNGEAHIGTPRSHGCIRLTNDDVITAFRRIDPGTRVLITE